jgi:hypothetical protein
MGKWMLIRTSRVYALGAIDCPVKGCTGRAVEVRGQYAMCLANKAHDFYPIPDEKIVARATEGMYVKKN